MSGIPWSAPIWSRRGNTGRTQKWHVAGSREIQKKMARKILRCGTTTTTEALRGDLGWQTREKDRKTDQLVGKSGDDETDKVGPEDL